MGYVIPPCVLWVLQRVSSQLDVSLRCLYRENQTSLQIKVCFPASLHMWKQFYKAFCPEGAVWYQPISMGLNQAQPWQVSRTLHRVGPPLVRAGMVIGCPSTHTAGKEADFGMLKPSCKKVLGMSLNSKRFMTRVWRIHREWFFFFKAFEQNKNQVRK